MAVLLFWLAISVSLHSVRATADPLEPSINLRIVNRCAANVQVLMLKVNPASEWANINHTMKPLEERNATCINGRQVRAKFLSLPDAPDGEEERSCEVVSEHLYCGYDNSKEFAVKIECDASSAFRCSAAEILSPCSALDLKKDAFCPARSKPLETKSEIQWDSMRCGGSGMVYLESRYFEYTTACPVCKCEPGTQCYGNDCGKCGRVNGSALVSRSTDAACIPDSWLVSPVPVQATSAAPTPAPVQAISNSSTPSSTRAPTLAPAAPSAPAGAPSKAVRRASSMAVLVIAILAGGIAACAIRNVVVKQYRHRRSSLGLYVDIPSTDFPTVEYQRQLSRRGSNYRGSVEMMVHDNDGL